MAGQLRGATKERHSPYIIHYKICSMLHSFPVECQKLAAKVRSSSGLFACPENSLARPNGKNANSVAHPVAQAIGQPSSSSEFFPDFLHRIHRGPEAIGPGALEQAGGLTCASAFA